MRSSSSSSSRGLVVDVTPQTLLHLALLSNVVQSSSSSRHTRRRRRRRGETARRPSSRSYALPSRPMPALDPGSASRATPPLLLLLLLLLLLAAVNVRCCAPLASSWRQGSAESTPPLDTNRAAWAELRSAVGGPLPAISPPSSPPGLHRPLSAAISANARRRGALAGLTTLGGGGGQAGARRAGGGWQEGGRPATRSFAGG